MLDTIRPRLIHLHQECACGRETVQRHSPSKIAFLRLPAWLSTIPNKGLSEDQATDHSLRRSRQDHCRIWSRTRPWRRRYERGRWGGEYIDEDYDEDALSFGDEDEDYEDLEDGECWNIWTSTFTWSVNFKTHALRTNDIMVEPWASPPWQSISEFSTICICTVAYIHICWSLVLRKVVLSTLIFVLFITCPHMQSDAIILVATCQVHTCSTVLISQLFCKWRIRFLVVTPVQSHTWSNAPLSFEPSDTSIHLFRWHFGLIGPTHIITVFTCVDWCYVGFWV
jgi:hypothetical protein